MGVTVKSCVVILLQILVEVKPILPFISNLLSSSNRLLFLPFSSANFSVIKLNSLSLILNFELTFSKLTWSFSYRACTSSAKLCLLVILSAWLLTLGVGDDVPEQIALSVSQFCWDSESPEPGRRCIVLSSIWSNWSLLLSRGHLSAICLFSISDISNLS